jgi:hypothetical protein
MVLLSLTIASLTLAARSRLSSAFFCYCLTPIFLISFTRSSSHLNLGLPMFLFPSGQPSRTFCGTLLLSIVRTCPSHSVLRDLISTTMSGLLYRLSSFLLELIRHVPFIHTGPYIHRKIFLSQDMRVAVDFSVSVQVSLPKRTEV